LLGDLKNVRPVLLPNRITADEINNKKPNRITSAGTEDAMLLKMMLQGQAPITPNPMCPLHNSHFVYKDICFWHWQNSNLKLCKAKNI
jgi:hypothetical protein